MSAGDPKREPQAPASSALTAFLTGNAAALLQYGALGLVAMFLWLGHSFMAEQMRSNREEVREFRNSLAEQMRHDRERNDDLRRAILESQAVVTTNQKAILGVQQQILAHTEAIKGLFRKMEGLEKKMEERP